MKWKDFPSNVGDPPFRKAFNASPRHIYETVYCYRGELENRVKELKDGLQLDRIMNSSKDQATLDRRKYSWYMGKLGEQLFHKSKYMKKLVPGGCKVIDGHAPTASFSNLGEVKHLDVIAYEPTTRQIRAICEVKTRKDPNRRDFDAHGVCADVVRRAHAVGIPIFLTVVRLKKAPPESIITKNGFIESLEFLLKNPEEHSIEFYCEGEFELRGERFVIVGT